MDIYELHKKEVYMVQKSSNCDFISTDKPRLGVRLLYLFQIICEHKKGIEQIKNYKDGGS